MKVFVAGAFNPNSASAAILEAVRAKRLLLVWNRATRTETEMILRRIPPLRRTDYSELFTPEGEFKGAVPPEAFSQIPDPDDRKFVALACAAGCPLVSNDDHLLTAGLEFDVFTPREFLEIQEEDSWA